MDVNRKGQPEQGGAMAAAYKPRFTAAVPRGGLAWRTTSYTFHLLWINLMFFSSALYVNYPAPLLSSVAEEVFLTSIVALAVSLTLCACFHRHFMALTEHAWLDYCGPVLAGIGIAVLAPSLNQGVVPPTAAIYGSAILTGLGSALTLINVGRHFVGVSTTGCITTVLWATMASALVTFASGLLPFAGVFATIVVAPFLAVASLHRVTKQETLHEHAARPLGERVPRHMLLKFVACATVLGIITGMLGGLSPDLASSKFSNNFLFTFCAASFIASAAILAIMTYRGRGTIENLYRPATFIITVGFALLPVFGANTAVPYAFVSAGYSLFEMLVWVVLCEVASRFQFTSVQVFGYGRAFVTGTVSIMMVVRPFADLQHNTWVLPMVAAISIIAVSLLRTYILTTADITALGKSFWEGNEDEGLDCLQPNPANEDAAPAQKKEPKVPFLKRCALIGEYYGLTKREVDVFRLLAAGRNSARIQEELMISAGTVNTHSYHVFQKMGVHCQQEVIDLFEKADLDAIAKELKTRGA